MGMMYCDLCDDPLLGHSKERCKRVQAERQASLLDLLSPEDREHFEVGMSAVSDDDGETWRITHQSEKR